MEYLAAQLAVLDNKRVPISEYYKNVLTNKNAEIKAIEKKKVKADENAQQWKQHATRLQAKLDLMLEEQRAAAAAQHRRPKVGVKPERKAAPPVSRAPAPQPPPPLPASPAPSAPVVEEAASLAPVIEEAASPAPTVPMDKEECAADSDAAADDDDVAPENVPPADEADYLYLLGVPKTQPAADNAGTLAPPAKRRRTLN